jgi:oligoendopeptidase F
MANEGSRIPKRSEVSCDNKWRLEDIYPSMNLWEEDYKEVKALALKLSEYKTLLNQSSTKLVECLNADAEMNRLFDKVYVYAQMKSHEDTTDGFYQGIADRADSLGTFVSSANSFIVPGILELPDETLNNFIEENEDLGFYSTYIEDIRRSKPHVLSANEEQLLAMTGEMANSPASIYNMINNADIKFPTIIDEKGQEIEVTKGRYIPFMESSDRRVRKDAFDALYSTYKKQINTLASTLSANVKANIFNANARKYNSAREASLFPDNVPVSVYDNLIEAVDENIHLMHRYVSLRKKLLKYDELHMYDLYTPIVGEVKMEIPFEQGVETVKKGLEVLGSQYMSDLKCGLSSGWIDVYENEGKRSGAYSWGCYDSHPYVLLNYTPTVDNMFTLAHEMGHAMHSFYSNSNQEYIYSGYKIFVAEVASTLNEAMLMDYLLKKTTDKKEKMYLLNHYMESFRGTVFRQTMFAEFEKIIHERAEAGESLTAELLSSIYHELNVKYYGPDMIVDDYIDYEWARIPHFYSSFYVYKYATGFSAATSLSQQIINEGEPALEKYLEFLKSGGSDYPLELLKMAGVDMTSPEPVKDALKRFEEVLNQFEQLINE